MTFFNKKEEVVKIELTQHGKYLLSKGLFKPAYYEFFDDDIIYDSKYAVADEELQRDIQTRIKEVPRPHTQYTFVSPESELKKLKDQARSSKMGSNLDTYVPYAMKHNLLQMPLGKSELGSQKKPAWNIRSFRNQFIDTKNFLTGNIANSKIVRLTLKDIEYNVSVANNSEFSSVQQQPNLNSTINMMPPAMPNLNNLTSKFADGTSISVAEDYILLDLRELNTDFENENFDLELYSVSVDENGEEELKQLYFINTEINKVVNNILLDEEPTKSTMDFTQEAPQLPQDTTDLVSKFFNFRVDREINSNILCANFTNEEKQLLTSTNQLEFECEEAFSNLSDPRIITDVKPEDAGEKC